jgi:hypothetical protein
MGAVLLREGFQTKWPSADRHIPAGRAARYLEKWYRKFHKKWLFENTTLCLIFVSVAK